MILQWQFPEWVGTQPLKRINAKCTQMMSELKSDLRDDMVAHSRERDTIRLPGSPGRDLRQEPGSEERSRVEQQGLSAV